MTKLWGIQSGFTNFNIPKMSQRGRRQSEEKLVIVKITLKSCLKTFMSYKISKYVILVHHDPWQHYARLRFLTL